MTNADKFKHLFGIYATELWAMPEIDFLEWLNADTQDMPTAERKTGKWIEYNATGKKQWMCSECCAEETNPKVARFCYWCGADMRGESDDIPIEYFESGGK